MDWEYRKDLSLAIKYYRLVANQGNSLAQFNLSIFYKEGIAVKRNLNLALKYCQLATNCDNECADLSVFYQRLGVTDLNLAISYYRLAAELGDASAQYILGWCYANGKGVSKDLNSAMKYYQLSANQGNKAAQSNLEYLLQNYPVLKKIFLNPYALFPVTRDNKNYNSNPPEIANSNRNENGI